MEQNRQPAFEEKSIDTTKQPEQSHEPIKHSGRSHESGGCHMSERKRIEIDSLEELKQLIEEKDEDTMLVITMEVVSDES